MTDQGLLAPGIRRGWDGLRFASPIPTPMTDQDLLAPGIRRGWDSNPQVLSDAGFQAEPGGLPPSSVEYRPVPLPAQLQRFTGSPRETPVPFRTVEYRRVGALLAHTQAGESCYSVSLLRFPSEPGSSPVPTLSPGGWRPPACSHRFLRPPSILGFAVFTGLPSVSPLIPVTKRTLRTPPLSLSCHWRSGGSGSGQVLSPSLPAVVLRCRPDRQQAAS
jgi:hypothetical protein